MGCAVPVIPLPPMNRTWAGEVTFQGGLKTPLYSGLKTVLYGGLQTALYIRLWGLRRRTMTLSERRLLQTVLVMALVLLGSASRTSAQATCDRACLRTMLDQYLDAVIKHDPKAAPLIVGFRQTENAINVAPGNGM